MKANNGQIDWSSLEDCKDENNLWDVACTFKDGLCFYFVTCNYLGSPRKQWSCSETHDHSAIPVCCDLVCGHWNRIFLPIWFDLKRKVISICYQIYNPFSVRFLFYKFKFLCDMHRVCIQNVYRWPLMQPLIINNCNWLIKCFLYGSVCSLISSWVSKEFMWEKGKIETMRNVTKAEGESERVGSEIVVSVYTKLIIRTSNQCRWLATTSHLYYFSE